MSAYIIAPPDGMKAPLKVNVFERIRITNTMLAPLFPYLDAGAMVPAVSMAMGGHGRQYQMFKHLNSVDEVGTIFAAKGAARGGPGNVFVGSREHFVNVGLSDPGNASSYIVIVVTQRQQDDSSQQHEKLSLICEQCHEVLTERPFKSVPDDVASTSQFTVAGYAPFHTHLEAALMIEQFNADSALRTCKECGFQSKPFSIESWGWDRYAKQTAGAAEAASTYDAAAVAVALKSE